MNDMFNIVKKGYDPIEVKRYINELEAVLTSYKEKDATIKNAIISAQAAADSIVRQAHDEAAEIRDEAHVEAAEIRKEAVRVFDISLAALASQKENINSYLEEYEALIHKYTSRFYKKEALPFFSKADDIDGKLLEIRASILEKMRAGEDGGK